ncbi:MAG: hypothetical protein KC420_00470 [Myxococcales bacterium]|nr:hypothetical protein [Myxococcales bacterium]MCB9569078.1 hypothetical protein [Myxococcales bacterium]MCB9701307.1 hypothetical protein [Myxococcales bacterium]
MRLAHLALSVTTFASLALAAPEAQAVPSSLRDGTKANRFEFGPHVGYGFGRGPGPAGAAWLDYLYHFKGNAEGPALGVVTHVGGWARYFGFAVGPMFEWDFKLIPSKPLGLYLGPHVAAGYGFYKWNKTPYHSFFAMAGPTVKLIVNDFWCFWARPVNIDMRWYGFFAASYGAAIGAGITW